MEETQVCVNSIVLGKCIVSPKAKAQLGYCSDVSPEESLRNSRGDTEGECLRVLCSIFWWKIE